MKNALITFKQKLDLDTIIDYKRKLIYDHYFIITNKLTVEEKELKKFKKFTIIVWPKNDLSKAIDDIYENYQDTYKFFPYFAGADAKTKYAIKIYNKTFGTKTKVKHFRLKHCMNDFLGTEIAQKKSIKFKYKEIKKTTYTKIKKELGSPFILKPVNAASSLLNFRITSNRQFLEAKNKLTSKYDYILEEYIKGNLYSLDLFCDGKNIFLLCFVREIPFLELLEKLSPEYMKKYKKSLKDEFLHFLPIRYTLDLSKLKPLELDFINKIGKQLIKKKYYGFIHLEYKRNLKQQQIGFIEWGARTGGRRAEFMEGMYNMRAENLPLEILEKKDFSRFKKKGDFYFLNNRNIDKNYLMIYTSVLKKTHITSILDKTPNYLKMSFERFLKNYLWDNWKVRVKDINFFPTTTKEGYLFPFYERQDTKFNYIMEFEEEPFKEFVRKKHSILEHLVFHDYKT